MLPINYSKEIKEKILNAKSIYIMAHKYIDLDAIGSAIGIYEYIKLFNKRATIVLNDKILESGVRKEIQKFNKQYKIKRSTQIKEKIDDSCLIIIVDTNKDYLLQDSQMFNKTNNIILIDHHDFKDESIKKGLIIIDENASSSCEMIAEFLHHEKVPISNEIATLLLSGIIVDTNNFILKTTTKTYKTAYILAEQGAKPLEVQYLLKQNLKEYINRQKVITNVKTINNVAISCANSRIVYRREDLAKIADTLLQFNHIEASFVIGKLDKNTIGISSRSMGIVNVGNILENFGGGGDNHEAGASIKNDTIKNIENKLKEYIKNDK